MKKLNFRPVCPLFRCRKLFLFVFFQIFLVIEFQEYVLAQPPSSTVALIQQSGNSHDYAGSDILVLFDSTYVEVEESGLAYFHVHLLQKVLTKEGASHLNVLTFDYDPLSAFLEIKEVIIHRQNGIMEYPDMEKTLDYPSPAHSIYWGARQKMVDLGRLYPGDAIEYSTFRKGFTYALLYEDADEKFIPPMRGHFYDIVPFWSDYPTLTKYYAVELLRKKYLNYHFYHGVVDTSTFVKSEKKVYCFTANSIIPIKKEKQMVDLSDVAPKLLLSTSPDWQSKSRWFYNVNEEYGSFNSSPEIEEKVRKIVNSAINEEDTISKLTHWVADEIRYLGLSMGNGEGYTIHSGQMTFNDRCGVCKDKAGLLVTMLRAVGFESYAAMTMAGSRIDNIPADQFNHCVTVVKRRNGELQLLDPTWVPFVRELWSSAEQEQDYLIGIPEGADLRQAPPSPPEDHFIRITVKSVVEMDGSMKGNLTILTEGQSDAALRRLLIRNRKSEWDWIIENELSRTVPCCILVGANYPDPYNYSEPLSIKLAFRVPGYAIVTPEEIIFSPFSLQNLFSSIQYQLAFDTTLESRNFGFRDRCSRQIEISETVSLPSYISVAYKPASIKSSGSGADFECQVIPGPNSCEINEKASYRKRVYKTEDWVSFRNAVAAQKRFANEVIILKR